MKYLGGKTQIKLLTLNEGDRPDGSIFYLDSEWCYRYFRLPTIIDRLYCHDEESQLNRVAVNILDLSLAGFTFTKQVSAA